jgi:catechol 2,3-dioxygenase-like lactoylglutathione lyase family enzyme
MPIEVLEIHHPAVRINGDEANMAANTAFYQGLLGLTADPGRPTIPGVPGFWINVGDTGQIHLIGGAQPSPLAKGPDQDPTAPHVALAVKDIAAAKAELDARGVAYWSMTGVAGPRAEQVFLRDPQNNMIELHQIDQCRCRVANRR